MGCIYFETVLNDFLSKKLRKFFYGLVQAIVIEDQ